MTVPKWFSAAKQALEEDMTDDSDTTGSADLTLRSYRRAYAPVTVDIFRRAIRELAGADYSPEQIAAWARDDIDLDAWHAELAAVHSIVAERDGRVLGWSDVNDAGYMDMLFVDPAAARQGVATRLLDHLVDFAVEHGIPTLTVHASLTARPFYERHGFTVIRRQQPTIGDVALTNFAMERTVP